MIFGGRPLFFGGARVGFGGHADACPRRVLRLGEEVFDDVAGDVGEAEVAAAVGVGEAGVFEAELVQDCGVHVVDVHLLFD